VGPQGPPVPGLAKSGEQLFCSQALGC
jgi:hypothetical protein